MIALTICCVVLGWFALRLKQVSNEQAALEELQIHIADAVENYEFYSHDRHRKRLMKLKTVEVKYDLSTNSIIMQIAILVHLIFFCSSQICESSR